VPLTLEVDRRELLENWCRLLEVCQIFGTLIADEQQVYDLNYLDDQLVLGIKGTLSVVELKVIRQRLLAGEESKARRGELFKRLPIGFARDAVGKVCARADRPSGTMNSSRSTSPGVTSPTPSALATSEKSIPAASSALTLPQSGKSVVCSSVRSSPRWNSKVCRRRCRHGTWCLKIERSANSRRYVPAPRRSSAAMRKWNCCSGAGRKRK
jgi:hypothetical protein